MPMQCNCTHQQLLAHKNNANMVVAVVEAASVSFETNKLGLMLIPSK